MSSREFFRRYLHAPNVVTFVEQWKTITGRNESEEICRNIMKNVNSKLQSLYRKAGQTEFKYEEKGDLWQLFCDVAFQVVQEDITTKPELEREAAIEKVFRCMHSCYELFREGLTHRTVTSQMFADPANDSEVNNHSPSSTVSLIYTVERFNSLTNESSKFGIKADHPITHIAHRFVRGLKFHEYRNFVTGQVPPFTPLDATLIEELYGKWIHDLAAYDGFTHIVGKFGDLVYESDVLIDTFDPNLRYLLQLSSGIRLESPVFVFDKWPIHTYIQPDPLGGSDGRYSLMDLKSHDGTIEYVALVETSLEPADNSVNLSVPNSNVYIQHARLLTERLDAIEKRWGEKQDDLQRQINALSRSNDEIKFQLSESSTGYYLIRRRELHSIFSKLGEAPYSGIKNAVSTSNSMKCPTLTRAEAAEARTAGNRLVHGADVLGYAVATCSARDPSKGVTYADFTWAALYGKINVDHISMLYDPRMDLPSTFQLQDGEPRRIAPARSRIVRALNVIAWFVQAALNTFNTNIHKALESVTPGQPLQRFINVLDNKTSSGPSIIPFRKPLYKRMMDVLEQIRMILDTLANEPANHFRVPSEAELPPAYQNRSIVFWDDPNQFLKGRDSFKTELRDFIDLQDKIQGKIVNDPSGKLPDFKPDILDYHVKNC